MGIISDAEKLVFVVVNYIFLCSLVGLFGIFSNVINLLVFYKQGLRSSINVTFFAMAISDLSSLLLQQWFNVCVNPLFETADLPLLPAEFQYMTAAVPRVAFSKITCLITVYATVERCLCIAFPLHVKQMITPERTAIVMACIYILTFLSISPVYYRTSIDWKYYLHMNKTLLGLVFASGSDQLTEIAYILQAVIGLASFTAVVIFTTILIRKLDQKSVWRKTVTVTSDRPATVSNRDRKTIAMVTLIASILIICYTPSFILFCVTFVELEFSVTGRYRNIFLAMWSFGFLLETINSSVNIFLYIKMSTKYRDTLYTICTPCKQIATKYRSAFREICSTKTMTELPLQC